MAFGVPAFIRLDVLGAQLFSSHSAFGKMTSAVDFTSLNYKWRAREPGIEQPMIANAKLPWLRDALTFSALLLLSPAVYPIHQPDRFQFPPSAPQGGSRIDVGPETGPQPPCEKEPIPSYPDLDHLATVKSWSKPALGADWKPPACTGWAEMGFTTLVTIAARFPYTSDPGSLLRHIGAISELAGMRYWSTTHKRWRTLVVGAHALTGPQSGQRREDFSFDEMKTGSVLYFEQVDNLSGKAIYRMHIIEASASRLVFDIENVGTMRYLFIPVLHPGELQSVYFLDRESDNVWLYYSIVRTGKNANGLIAGNESSSINRAVAFYRHLVGIPSNQEPPGAR